MLVLSRSSKASPIPSTPEQSGILGCCSRSSLNCLPKESENPCRTALTQTAEDDPPMSPLAQSTRFTINKLPQKLSRLTQTLDLQICPRFWFSSE
ncbi:hypothetical protein VTN96DRAFT_5747 [Rasamsonia emersonii]